MNVFPKWVHTLYMIINTFGYDCKRVLKHCFGYEENLETLKANLILVIHTVEKGLTMPETRLGFGQDKITIMSTLLDKIIPLESDSFELIYAKSVLEEYLDFHEKRGFIFPEKTLTSLQSMIGKIGTEKSQTDSLLSKQLHFSREEFFSPLHQDFKEFSFSRHSVRNYIQKPIDKDVFIRVAEIANQAPSSCNRQSCRMHVVVEREKIERVLSVQGGSRGFGHLAAAVIIVTSDLHSFYDVQERSQPAINSGFFGMNILYALHAEQLGACVLNWSSTKKKDLQLRKLVPSISDSEQVEFLISCGYPPEEFDVALSKRRSTSEIVCFE